MPDLEACLLGCLQTTKHWRSQEQKPRHTGPARYNRQLQRACSVPRERGAGRERLHCLLHICSNHQPKTRSSKRKEPESFPHHFAGLLCPWDSPGKNTGVIAISFSRGSARPRDPIWFCYIAGRFFFLPSEPPGKPPLCPQTSPTVTQEKHNQHA